MLPAGSTPEQARACLFRQLRFALEAGIDAIQIRERDLDARVLVDLVTSIVHLSRGTGCRVLVNDRVDVALAAGADGVHLRADSIAAVRVREIAPRPFLIGRSVHSASEAAASLGADYLIAGTVWASGSKPAGHRELSPAGLAAIVRASPVPVLAIGGVTPDRIPEVARSGAAGVAAIGLFMSAVGTETTAECRAAPLGELADAARARFKAAVPRSG